MKNAGFRKQEGMVLIDNFWIEDSEANQYLADRKKAAQKAILAMSKFCNTVALKWAGTEDGEAVVGFDADSNIRSLIHLNPQGVQLILSMKQKELVKYLK